MPKRLLTILIPWLFASCAALNRYVYRSNPINLPGLTEKGQSRLTADVGGNIQMQGLNGLGGVDLQGAYAVSNRLTLLGGYSGRSGSDAGSNLYQGAFYPLSIRDSNNAANLHYRNNTWELGAAYTMRFGRHVFMSVSAGGGAGNYHIDDNGALYDTLYRAYLDAHLTQWFVQPAMYFKLKAVDLGVGFRLAWSHFSNVTTNYTSEQQTQFSVGDLQGKDMNMFQPFWVLRIRPHLSWLQIELQGSLNIGGNSSSTTSYNYYYLNGGVGVSIDPVRLLRR